MFADCASRLRAATIQWRREWLREFPRNPGERYQHRNLRHECGPDRGAFGNGKDLCLLIDGPRSERHKSDFQPGIRNRDGMCVKHDGAGLPVHRQHDYAQCFRQPSGSHRSGLRSLLHSDGHDSGLQVCVDLCPAVNTSRSHRSRIALSAIVRYACSILLNERNVVFGAVRSAFWCRITKMAMNRTMHRQIFDGRASRVTPSWVSVWQRQAEA